MKRTFYVIIALAAIFITLALAQQDAGPEIGRLAPNFTLADQDGIEHTLSQYQGGRVLLYFYPKDETPGCTKQACSFRDAYSEFETAGITILGISYDTPESHRKFIDNHNLPFALLSDSKKEVAALYGTKGIFPLALRHSFLIDENGLIIAVIKDVDVTSHAADVLRLFQQAGS